VLIARVRKVAGAAAPARLLTIAESPRTLEFLEDIGNWISYGEAVALWTAGAEVTGDELFARHVGENFVKTLAGSSNSTVLRSLGSPEELLRKIAMAGHRFSTAADLEAIEVRSGHAVIHATACPGFERHRLHCEWTAGLLSQATALFGLAPAGVEHALCQARGDAVCVYELSWEEVVGAEPDPQEQIAVLTDQIDAMSARLQSVFDTAADLIAESDIDRTLARITDRAGLQVRAPHFLLAIRPSSGADVHLHQNGFTEAEANRVSRRVLDADADQFPDHWLVARVCSHLNDYGALVAVHKPGTSFFPQERQLLEVYARYAATALDTATALAEARSRQREAQQRDEESRTLLELARRLARAGSSDQVARRLADAIPAVVDCDRTGVYLWHEDEGMLVRQAVRSAAASDGDELGLTRVLADEIPQLADWVRHPDQEPLFIDMDTSPVSRALREVGAVAAVAVPIASAERFLGCFVVSVRERPERLASTPELLDRLSGVAAHAVTALDNGRLVDHITHQATHDQLTGAANRIGFHEKLAAATERAGEAGSVALFYIDLDGFKPVNDQHGHETGDRLLQAVATRLEARVRAGDTVARLGGDEFAVLAEGITAPAQLDAITRRVERAFEEPLAVNAARIRITASVGRAVWPLDGGEPADLLRRADIAMYEAKRGMAPTRA
jgi:diguanylate cyclase (GGDEF)-like protein